MCVNPAPQQSEDFPFFDIKGNTRDCGEIAVLLDEVVDFENVRHVACRE